MDLVLHQLQENMFCKDRTFFLPTNAPLFTASKIKKLYFGMLKGVTIYFISHAPVKQYHHGIHYSLGS